jgi:hypothetical protein
MLPCGHTYCHSCICLLMAAAHGTSPLSATCPACRVVIPTKPASFLPRNYAIENAAFVVRSMGSDVWMAAALIGHDGDSMAQTTDAAAAPESESNDPTTPSGPATQASPPALSQDGRSRSVAARRPTLSRSALAMASGGVSVSRVVSAIAELVFEAAPTRLSLQQVVERLAASSYRVWPPTGFLPVYFGSRCLAVPAAALQRPDASLLRAFLQWDAAVEAATKRAAIGSEPSVGACSRPLHLERSSLGSLAEVVCIGGPHCRLPPTSTAATAEAPPPRYLTPAARARLSSASALPSSAADGRHRTLPSSVRCTAQRRHLGASNYSDDDGWNGDATGNDYDDDIVCDFGAPYRAGRRRGR